METSKNLWIGDKPITIEKVDDYTVVFKFPEPSAAAANNIANETYIIPKHVYGNVSDFSVKELKRNTSRNWTIQISRKQTWRIH